MAYTSGSAADRAALLTALLAFLNANGWSVSGSEATNSAGTTFAFDVAIAIVNEPTYPSGTTPDGYFGVKIKTDSFGIAGYSALRYSNDFTGPFTAYHFFTDGVTCALVVKAGNLRYSHMVFGHLDKHDLYTLEVPFICGTYYEWWWDQSNYSSDQDSGFNYVRSDNHHFGWAGDDTRCLALVQDGIVDPALGFTDGLYYPSWHTTTKHMAYVENSIEGSGTLGDSYILDYFTGIINQSMTGGVPLHCIPCVADAGTQLCYLGDLGIYRLVSMAGLSPGQVLSFAGDDWMVFPLKQQGDLASQCFGATPLPIVNSGMWGFAFKK